jgi:hypothetical protein
LSFLKNFILFTFKILRIFSDEGFKVFEVTFINQLPLKECHGQFSGTKLTEYSRVPNGICGHGKQRREITS